MIVLVADMDIFQNNLDVVDHVCDEGCREGRVGGFLARVTLSCAGGSIDQR